jgi:hypothetical protein
MNQPAENPIKYALVINKGNQPYICLQSTCPAQLPNAIYYLATEHFASHALTGPRNKKKKKLYRG